MECPGRMKGNAAAYFGYCFKLFFSFLVFFILRLLRGHIGIPFRILHRGIQAHGGGSIKGLLLDEIRIQEIQGRHLTNANQAFERNIAAALALGDMALLCTDIDWVAGLLENNEIPRAVLHRYLKAYHRAAETHLDDRGRVVVDYLATLNENGAPSPTSEED